MAHFPSLLTKDDCRAMMTRMQACIDADGFGFWAIEARESGALLGLAGLSRPRFDAAFTPCVEIGWRLRRDAWGRGYATEAARKALEIGFTQFMLPEIVAFTVPQNKRSRRVMEKLEMTHNKADDFKHPRLAENHRLSDHVLYRLSRHRWRKSQRKGRPSQG